jgi:hypothetical protein
MTPRTRIVESWGRGFLNGCRAAAGAVDAVPKVQVVRNAFVAFVISAPKRWPGVVKAAGIKAR